MVFHGRAGLPVQVQRLGAGRRDRPVFSGFPLVFADGEVFHGRSFLHTVFHIPQEMVHPLEVQQVHVVADGLQAHGNAVDVVAAVKAVDPRAKDGLALSGGPVVDQLQRLGGAHAVVVEPAGEDQRGMG